MFIDQDSMPPLDSFSVRQATLIPDGDIYTMTPDGLDRLPPGAVWGAVNLPGRVEDPNKFVCSWIMALTGNESFNNYRHTIAMDVLFSAEYLDDTISTYRHMGLIAHHKTPDYRADGDNRGVAVIAGSWGEGAKMFAVEEIEITDDFRWNMHARTHNQLVHGIWYRMSVEFIRLQGRVVVEARIWDKASGRLVMQLPHTYSDFPQNYGNAPGYVSLFSAEQAQGNFAVTNLKNYISRARNWIPTP